MNDEYESLIDKLVLKGHIKSSEIEQSFRKYNRADFLPDKQKIFAGEDRPLDIGHNQTNSQPFTVAFIMNLLELRKGDTVLDVGAGSGWQAAIISDLVFPEGKVISVERIKELADMAKENLQKFNLISNKAVSVFYENAFNISPEWPVFNKIVSAAEYYRIPESWKNYLAVGGRIVMPVLGRIVVADKISKSGFITKEYPGFSFIPLVDN